jgi:hypothetical protein
MYRKNITDKQQSDIETFVAHGAQRLQWFDGKAEQVGETKSLRTTDLQAQGNAGSTVTSALRQFGQSGHSIGCHNDKPAVFETPGRV